MSVPLVVLGVLVAMTVAAIVASAPMTYGARRRKVARRRHWVSGHPDTAKSHDVVDLLRRSGLLVREARSLTAAATERGVRSVTLYRWLDRLDDDVRVTVLRAGLSDAHLVDHVSRGTLPDLPGVREFAAAHGLAVAPVEERAPRHERIERPESPAGPEDLAAEVVVPDSVAVETLEDVEQLAAVAVQEAPVVAPAAVPVTVAPVAPAAGAAKPATAEATLLGSGLGTQAPVP
jgi:hypothetical protein